MKKNFFTWIDSGLKVFIGGAFTTEILQVYLMLLHSKYLALLVTYQIIY